jgi:hypothetical protein
MYVHTKQVQWGVTALQVPEMSFSWATVSSSAPRRQKTLSTDNGSKLVSQKRTNDTIFLEQTIWFRHYKDLYMYSTKAMTTTTGDIRNKNGHWPDEGVVQAGGKGNSNQGHIIDERL